MIQKESTGWYTSTFCILHARIPPLWIRQLKRPFSEQIPAHLPLFINYAGMFSRGIGKRVKEFKKLIHLSIKFINRIGILIIMTGAAGGWSNRRSHYVIVYFIIDTATIYHRLKDKRDRFNKHCLGCWAQIFHTVNTNYIYIQTPEDLTQIEDFQRLNLLKCAISNGKGGAYKRVLWNIKV